YVFLDALRGWSEDPSLFDGAQWRQVYEGLAPHADLALERDLAREIDSRLRSVLQSPQIRERLTRGDAGHARLYAVVVGQSSGEARCAEFDAREVAKLLREKA